MPINMSQVAELREAITGLSEKAAELVELGEGMIEEAEIHSHPKIARAMMVAGNDMVKAAVSFRQVAIVAREIMADEGVE